MSFYEFGLPCHPGWLQWHQDSQYTLSTPMSYMDFVPPAEAAVVPTLSPSLSPSIHNCYAYNYDQYLVPVDENHPQMYQGVNEHYKLLYSNLVENTNTQTHIRKRALKHYSKKTSTSTNLIQTRVAKRKRHRTVFKIEQVEALEMFYKHKQFVTQQERQQLQELLQISDKTIKVWFQNRRLKDRKDNKQISAPNELLENLDVFQEQHNEFRDINQEIDRLTEEIQQKQEKDELDDFLLNVITSPNPGETSVSLADTQTPNTFYEPISPAESCEEKDVYEIETFNPKELLKTFLNFQ